jgi:hypothetical protein
MAQDIEIHDGRILPGGSGATPANVTFFHLG